MCESGWPGTPPSTDPVEGEKAKQFLLTSSEKNVYMHTKNPIHNQKNFLC